MKTMYRKYVLTLTILFIAVIFIISHSTNVFAQNMKIPVIVLFNKTLTNETMEWIQNNGGDITMNYTTINGFAGNLTQKEIILLKNNPNVISVESDAAVKILDNDSDAQIRANQVWKTMDEGQGVSVAVLDTGIDMMHTEFSGRIIECHNQIYKDHNTCNDLNGHGTHVAGIIGAVGINPEAKGVSPAIFFYVDQVLDSNGSGSISKIIAGIDWAIKHKVQIISMSLGTGPISTTQPNCDDSFHSLTRAIHKAVSDGIVVVAAAGNYAQSGVAAPACISDTIAVGAVDGQDRIASFSSIGSPMTDHGIVAPGVSIYSSVPTSFCPWCDPSGYTTLSGTSMAAPQVTGTIALLLEKDSHLSPSEIQQIIFTTACSNDTSPSCSIPAIPNSTYGFGRIDAFRAYNAIPSTNH